MFFDKIKFGILEDSRPDLILFLSSVSDEIDQELIFVAERLSEMKDNVDCVDIVILDLGVPDDSQDGVLEFARVVGQTKPVIIRSGNSDPRIAEQCGEIGVGYLSKHGASGVEVKLQMARAKGLLKWFRNRW